MSSRMTQRVTVPALMAALTVVFYGFAQLPVVGTPLLFVCPLPIVFACVRQGPSIGALTLLTSSVIIALLMTPVQAYLFVAPFGVLGLLAGILYHRDEPPHTHLWVLTVCLAVVIYLETVFLDEILGGQQPLNTFIDETAKQFAQFAQTMRGSMNPAALDPTDLGSVLLDPQKAAGLARQAFLVPIWLSSLLAVALAYTNQVASFLVGMRIGTPVAPPCSLRRLTCPRIVGLAPLVFGWLWLGAGGTSGGRVASLYFNLMMLGFVAMYFAGTAVSVAIVDRANPSPIERMVIGLLTLAFAPLTIFLGMLECLLGIRDQLQAPPEVTLETVVRPESPARSRPGRRGRTR